ncbi:uncharacterized protein LOC128984967 [Macrosteles quadrilineatus]|uniref:uncharacterized protein LOC128984967 n=1 Tax=Macrosteles quadrilineatus TaxID=74068 RepID=UPI0023E1D1DE|nr:uncharacterized protein LOC128984967 [Macrosteles quadrilineatus]
MTPLEFCKGNTSAVVDLQSHSLKFKRTGFTDDTTLVTKGKNIDPLLEEANNALRLAKDWFIANKLKINEEKTQTLMCSLKIGLEDNSVKLLGFWMDSKLSWHHHIEKCYQSKLHERDGKRVLQQSGVVYSADFACCLKI